MNSLKWTSIALVVDASPGRLAWNQLGIVFATVNLNWVDNPCLIVSAIRISQVSKMSRSNVSRHVSGRLASTIQTKSSLLLLTSIQ